MLPARHPVRKANAGRWFQAVRTNDVNAVRSLIAAGADLSRANEGGQTPLLVAAQGGFAEIVRLLLEAGAPPDSSYTSTPLVAAAWNGHEDVVRLLLEAGASVDSRDEGGSTPLMAAAAGGHPPIVQLLVAAGADPNALYHASGEEWTALTFAAAEAHTRVFAYLDPLTNPRHRPTTEH